MLASSFSIAAAVTTMTSLVIGVTQGAFSTSSTNYASPISPLVVGIGPNASLTLRQVPASAAHTVQRFYVQVTNPPGTGKSLTFGVNVNGSNVATITISDSATSGSWSGSASINAGDLVCLACTPSGTPAAPGIVYWGWDQVATGASYNVYGYAGGVGASNTFYGLPYGHGTSNTTEGNGTGIVPCSGTIRRLRAATTAGISNNIVVTLRKNGVDTALSVTITGTSFVADLSDTFTVSAGDALTVKAVAGATAATVGVRWSYEFVPDTIGDWYILHNPSSTTNNTSVTYEALGYGNGGWSISSKNMVVPFSFDIKNFFCASSSAPGAAASGKKYVYGVAKNSVATTAIATLLETATTANTTGVTASFSQGELISMINTPTSSPTVTNIRSGFLCRC